ncbi:MAG: ABC transporter substrate-binding protein [Alphaproteobacteria bacterium]|jgi:putative ABC transport system substrate-binding protein|nr:MAG: ABC transporter substrate-binding protein [Alphaproteobacteria bacterium]
MRRREVIVLLGAAIALPSNLYGQEPTRRMRRIGYLSSGLAAAVPRFTEAFRRGMRDLGWVEGQNIFIEYRFAEGKLDQLPDLASYLVRQQVELIFATPGSAAVAASKATSTIPIIMRGVGDPVALGLIRSLGSPSTNVTGLSYSVGTATIGKGLELLKEAVPSVERVAILSNPSNPSHPVAIDYIKDIARLLGVQLQLLEARGPDEFELAFGAMAKENVGGLLVIADPTFLSYVKSLLEFTMKYRLPSVHGLREEVDAGGLMSYGPNTESQFRQAAVYVDKILKGTKPSELPVEQPTHFELVVNLRTAKVLGLTMSPMLLARADDVIE